MKKIFLALAIVINCANISIISQNKPVTNDYKYPLNTAPILSANFGELRENHFHSGIDMKTDGAVNKPVFAVEDGYISRISVSEYGYGLALYIDHPNGKTSLYGHLNKFSKEIEAYIKELQYNKESYTIDVKVAKDSLPVAKGDIIALSGNTGSSFGPHVHFEFRDSKTEEVLDALPYYKRNFKDTTPPEIRGLAVYPITGKGVVNNSSKPSRYTLNKLKNGDLAKISSPIYAWGKIGFGIYAVDRMDNTHNVYGVKKVTLWRDDEEIFSSDISSFFFHHSRMINSLTDFDYWKRSKVFYMKSFIEEGNKLPIYESVNNGYVNINEEKEYKFHYLLEDAFGNTSEYSFTVMGKKNDIPEQGFCSLAMVWNQNNYYITENFKLYIPKKSLYTDVAFTLNETENDEYLSSTYMVNNNYVPLDKSGKMSIKLKTDTVSNKNQYGIISIKADKISWVGGKYKDGYLQSSIGELGGTYAISTDKKAPMITPNKPERWVQNRRISIKVIEDLSGIQYYRGTIDGKYVLFEHDGKSDYYTYRFDSSRLEQNRSHKLVFVASDSCGNESKYEYEFFY